MQISREKILNLNNSSKNTKLKNIFLFSTSTLEQLFSIFEYIVPPPPPPPPPPVGWEQ